MNSIQPLINSIDPGMIVTAFPILPIAIGVVAIWSVIARMREIWK